RPKRAVLTSGCPGRESTRFTRCTSKNSSRAVYPAVCSSRTALTAASPLDPGGLVALTELSGRAFLVHARVSMRMVPILAAAVLAPVVLGAVAAPPSPPGPELEKSRAFHRQMVAKANDAVAQARLRADKDLNRPAYHFQAPALWMNDPNGP